MSAHGSVMRAPVNAPRYSPPKQKTCRPAGSFVRVSRLSCRRYASLNPQRIAETHSVTRSVSLRHDQDASEHLRLDAS
jgi:hypothetical protein